MIDAPLNESSDWSPRWPQLEKFMIPIGQGKITREGEAATVVSYGRTLPVCNDVADELMKEGVRVEVIDMRSLYPYDWQMIKSIVLKI